MKDKKLTTDGNWKLRTDGNWERYHTTRELLLNAIEVHLKSIGLINVYNSGSRTDIPLNTSGDYGLRNESLGVNELNKLKERLTI